MKRRVNLRRETPRHRGVSIVEILVAMGIMAVLAALVIPALSTTRTRAALATATQNLRQNIVGFNLYAAENNGAYPPTGNDVSRMQAAWNGGYLTNEKIFINPINKAKGTPVGQVYLGGGKYTPCYFSANASVYTNWNMSGGAVLAPVRTTDSPSIPIICDQRADRLWANNYVTLPDGKPGGLFGYPDGVVLLLGEKNNVMRNK